MHMADALVSVPVGATLWAVSGSLIAWCSRRLRNTLDDRLIPLMGVMGAFTFAAQMINFAIPLTGSSGHLSGALMLALLLGPHAGFLVIASVLTVQALLFADGGVLALGCNIFNIGFFPCFIAAPLIYRLLAGPSPTHRRHWFGCVVTAIISLQFGAIAVVIETHASHMASLPLDTFLTLMLPTHLAIGLVEGVATAAIMSFLQRARPADQYASAPRDVVWVILLVSLFLGSIGCWYASSRPDGLEWSLEKAGIQHGSTVGGTLHEAAAAIQHTAATLPNYNLPGSQSRAGQSLAGVVGGSICLLIALLMGYALRHRHLHKRRPA